MAQFQDSAPVLIGVGEASGARLNTDWPSPVDLAAAAIHAGLCDSGQSAALAAIVDCMVAVRTFEDSGVSMGTGSPENVPRAYASAAGLTPRQFVYADVGGQSSQALVNEFAGAVSRGEYRAVVIAGAEAIGTAKRARKAGIELDWRMPDDADFDNRLSAYPILSRGEIRHGIVSMPLAYSLIETARRTQLRLGIDAYLAEMAKLWSSFSAKSMGREHAQFPHHWDAEGLLSGARGNYRLTEIYRRWMVAQDGVDLGGAIILTTAGTAREIGIGPDKMVWLVGAAEAAEPPVSERSNISGSDAQEFAVDAALQQAGITAGDLGPIDIYSCFPCAVFAAVDTMHLPQRPLGDYTLTGGLTFFGGPGNGYSLHAIAAVVQALRQDGSRPGMVSANGGVMTKQAVGIYSAHPPARDWPGAPATGYIASPQSIGESPAGRGRILSYTRPVVKDAAGDATLLIEMENTQRALAVIDASSAVIDTDLAGRLVNVTAGEKRHHAALC